MSDPVAYVVMSSPPKHIADAVFYDYGDAHDYAEAMRLKVQSLGFDLCYWVETVKLNPEIPE